MNFLSDLLQSGLVDARCRQITKNKEEEEHEERLALFSSIVQSQKTSPDQKDALRQCQDIYLQEHLNRFYKAGFADAEELTGNKSEKKNGNVYADSVSFQVLAKRNDLKGMKNRKLMDYQVQSELLAYLAGFIDAVSTIYKES